MAVYVYQAELYCEDCGREIVDELRRKGVEDTGDTDDFPQYFPDDSESDSPNHCPQCEELLTDNLTSDGRLYVAGEIRHYLRTGQGRREILSQWIAAFDIDLGEVWGAAKEEEV